jgi:lysophospholipase L1-like esterase
MLYHTPALAGLAFTLAGFAGPESAEPFALKDGDRVVFLGGGFFEQERLHGQLETRLTSHFPDAAVVFRNLGWPGDTVRGSARTAGFQNPDGLARLVKEVQELKPTVLFLGYGMNESFDGPPGLAGFIADYEKLLAKVVTPKMRVVLLAPTCHEDLGRPLPDPAGHNRDLDAYTAALKKLAERRGFAFVDLFHALQSAKSAHPAWRLTTNGIHLTQAGSAVAARVIEEQLGQPARTWRVEMDSGGKVLARQGTVVDMVHAADGALCFRVHDDLIPVAAVGPVPGDALLLKVAGLAPGQYVLKMDGEEVYRATAADWQKGVTLTAGPAFRDFLALRDAVLHKDQLFYRRWRPFNDHSRHWDFMRGDYALYDKEIAGAEEVIAKTRRPRPYACEIVAKGGPK